MKKLFALVLCLIMVLSVFAACGGNAAGSKGGLETKGTGETTPPVTQKVETYNKEGLTLTVGIRQNANVIDYDTNFYTLWLEEQLGFDLEFVFFQNATADWQAQLTGMITTGDPMPDVLLDMTLSKAAVVEYGQAGYFLDMAPYINDPVNGAVWHERMSELPEDVAAYAYNSCATGDGTLYTLGRIEYSLIDTIDYAPWINTAWLDKLGLKMPTSTEELYEVLVAFRDKDPDGNGKNDQYPLIGAADGSQGNLIGWIINMFTPFDAGDMLSVDDNGKVYFPYVTDEYREALKFIAKLIEEDLMFDTVYTMSTKEIKALVNPPKGESNKVGIFCGHPSIVFQNNNESLYEYDFLPYWGYFNRKNQSFNLGAYITKDCEVPQAAWDLFMMMCTKESSYIQRYGKPGEDWVEATPGSKSFLGWDAEMRILIDNWGLQTNNHYCRIMCTVLTSAENEASELSDQTPEWLKWKYSVMRKSYDEAAKAKTPKYVYSHVYVPVEVQADPDTKEAWENGKDVLKKAMVSFTKKDTTSPYNDINNDAQWEAYVKEFWATGIEKPLSFRQQLYTEQFGGK